MNIVSLLSGKVFKTTENLSLIEAAEQAGLVLPYSCRNGRCCTCKCKIIGPTRVIFDEMGLTKVERKNGWKLACARVATGNVSLDIEDLSNIKFPKPKLVPAKINTLEFLSTDILKVTLRLPPGNNFEFIEGQYIDLIGPKGVCRSYSLARHRDGMELELHIQRVTGGIMSNYLFDGAQVGDLLRINGPRGSFMLRHTPDTHIIFLATGTGIAPIKAMIEHMENMPKELKPKSVKVYWGVRKQEDLYWNPCDVSDDLDFIPVLSRSDHTWSGERGYVQDVMMQKQADFENVQVYACGSDAMIRSSRAKIEFKNIKIKDFFSDAFVASGNERS